MIEYIILGIIGALFLMYFYFEWQSKRITKKLQEAYKPEDDTSRRENYRRTVEATSSGTLPGESNSEGNAESKGGFVLPASDDNSTSDDQRELEQSKPERKGLLSRFRRKKVEVEEML